MEAGEEESKEMRKNLIVVLIVGLLILGILAIIMKISELKYIQEFKQEQKSEENLNN